MTGGGSELGGGVGASVCANYVCGVDSLSDTIFEGEEEEEIRGTSDGFNDDDSSVCAGGDGCGDDSDDGEEVTNADTGEVVLFRGTRQYSLITIIFFIQVGWKRVMIIQVGEFLK